jgi:hypothetical protein
VTASARQLPRLRAGDIVCHTSNVAMFPGVALLRLRKIDPDLVRPFKVPHVLVAVVFTFVSGVLAGDSAVGMFCSELCCAHCADGDIIAMAISATIMTSTIIMIQSSNTMFLPSAAVNALWETPSECAMAFAFMLAGYPASVLIERARNRQNEGGIELQ